MHEHPSWTKIPVQTAGHTPVGREIRLTAKHKAITLPAKFCKEVVMAYVIGEDCTACGTCQPECPVSAISEGDIYKIDPELCTDCGACAEVCPVECIAPGE
jgi:ferredoxin